MSVRLWELGIVTWLLLIYVVPSEPSRKRATIWRELKKVGAVYVRDGVCALPTRLETPERFHAIADRVIEFGGQVTLVEDARLNAARERVIVEQANTARAEEYAEVASDAEGLLAHVEREREHREFTFAEVKELEVDLGKLKRWADQIHTRDYFGSAGAVAVEELLSRCEAGLAPFREETYAHTEATAT